MNQNTKNESFTTIFEYYPFTENQLHLNTFYDMARIFKSIICVSARYHMHWPMMNECHSTHRKCYRMIFNWRLTLMAHELKRITNRIKISFSLNVTHVHNCGTNWNGVFQCNRSDSKHEFILKCWCSSMKNSSIPIPINCVTGKKKITEI